MSRPAAAGAGATRGAWGGGPRSWVLAVRLCAAVSLAAVGAGASADAGGAETTAGSTTTVVYKTLFNGQEATDEGRTILEYRDGIARIRTEPAGTLRPEAPEESGHIDYGTRRTWQTARLRDGSRSTVATELADLPALEATADSAQILGHACRRWKTVIRSNQIDVWATSQAGILGTPALNLVVPDGLVLRVVRNNNYELVAVEIDTVPDTAAGPLLPADWGAIVDAPTHRARLAESWVTRVTVFDREQIAFGNEIHNPPGEDDPGVYRYAGGSVILRRVDLPDVPDDAMVLAEVVQYSNGDAYDRTGSVFLIPASTGAAGGTAGAPGAPAFLDALRHGVDVLPKTQGRDGRVYQGIVAGDGYAPPIELVRFITPFGIRHYNEQVKVVGMTWEDSALYKLDLTELLPVLRGQRTMSTSGALASPRLPM